MAASTAREIVSRCLALRFANPDERPLDTLDRVMRGHRLTRVDFGRDAIPPASFALFIAAAFDEPRALAWQDFFEAPPAERALLLTVWACEVWPQFLARYGIE